MERARAEVDEVLGDTASPTFEQVHRLTYVRQVLDESLRLWPTAPGFSRYPFENTTIGGRYAIPANTTITVLTPALHRATSVWGPDAAEFNPEHMAPERLASVSPTVYKPFGTGQRACIGRQFALQEAALVLGMLLQRFDLVDHLDYQLATKTTLTVKPADFRIQVRPRPDVHIRRGEPADPAKAAATSSVAAPAATPAVLVPRHGTRLTVLFGSNLGTAESLATRLAQEGTERGFDVTVGALDDHVGDLPVGGALVIVTASYNGTPPDNAAAFCRWISGAAPDAAKGVSYTVFGCGNTEWAATYQAIPTLLDEQLEQHGGERVHTRGEGNAAGDFDADYRAWHGAVWSDIAEALDLPKEVAEAAPSGPRLSITLTNRQITNPVIVSYEAHPGLVRDSRELIRSRSGDGAPERSVRHIEIGLPAGMSYQAGDHLGVLPRNGFDTIRRVMARFGLDAGQYLTIIPNSGTHTHLPIEEPTPLLGVLGSCVELQDVATRDDIAVLARHTDDPQQKTALEAMTGDDDTAQAAYRERVYVPNRSVLDLLEEFPACHLPFEVYLDLLPALRPRYYSISSSPLVSPDTCSITAGVLSAPARSGDGTVHGRLLEPPGPRPGRRHRLRVRAPAVDPVPAAGEPARPDDHDRRGHRAGSLPRVPPGASGAPGPEGPRRPVAAALRVPQRGRGPAVRRRAGVVRGAGPGQDGALLLGRARAGAQVRPAGDARLRRRGVGPVAAGRSRPRVRERVHHRSGRPRVPDADLPGPDRGRGE